MPVSCEVSSCRYPSRKNDGRTMHSFPTHGVLRAAWLSACGVTDPSPHARVCGIHFAEEDYGTNKKRLLATAVPTQHLPVPKAEDSDRCLTPPRGSPGNLLDTDVRTPVAEREDTSSVLEMDTSVATSTMRRGCSAQRRLSSERKRQLMLSARSANERRLCIPAATWQQLTSFAADQQTTPTDAVKVLLDMHYHKRAATSPARKRSRSSAATTSAASPSAPSVSTGTASVATPTGSSQSVASSSAATTSAATPLRPIPSAAITSANKVAAAVSSAASPSPSLWTPSTVKTLEPAENTDPWTPIHNDYTEGTAEYDSEEEEVTERDGAQLPAEEDETTAPPKPGSCWEEPGCIVSSKQLEELLVLPTVRCSGCGLAAQHTISRTSLSFCVTWKCNSCAADRPIRRWWSSPREGQTSVLDTMFAAAIVMTGNSYHKVRRLFDTLNVGVISASSFYRLARHMVLPVIDERYEAIIKDNIESCKAASPDGLVVAGDCQNDSPGFSAAYGTYTVMDCDSHKILAQAVVSRQETNFMSPRLEVEGARRCLQQLCEADCSIQEYVSDQHLGVKKLVGDTLPSCLYSYDTWHAGKILSKDLRNAASKVATSALMQWVTHLRNHFWYCVEHCDESVGILQKMLEMALHHVCGVHETALNECCHDAGEPDDHPPYLKYGSPAHNALKEVLLSNKMMKKLPFLIRYRHTGRLECYHNTTLVYTPKRVFFGPAMFTARKRMSVIDYSAHLQRPILLNADGSEKCSLVYSRAQGKFVSRPMRDPKAHTYVESMLLAMLVQRRRVVVTDSKPMAPTDPRRVYPYVHRGVRPSEDDADKLREERERHRRFRTQDDPHHPI